MEYILRTGFGKIKHSIQFQPESEPKGRRLVESGHVQRVEEFVRNGNSYVIRCKVIRQASVSKTPYSTSLRLGAGRTVTSTSCDCVYKDSGKCKHVAAAIHFVNNEESLSKTSYEQTWGKPSLTQLISEKYSKGAWLSEMFKYLNEPPEEDIPLNIPALLEEIDTSSVRQMLCHMSSSPKEPIEESAVPIVRENEPEATDSDCGVCFDNFLHFTHEHPVYQKEYILSSPLKEFYDSHVSLPLCELREKFCDTVEQSKCEDWHDFRKVRTSASSDVHKIKVRTKATEESLVSKLLSPNNFTNASTRYGLLHEPVAIKLYEKLYNCDVKRVGVLSSVRQPWICASLDGVVVYDGCIVKILEIKCPSSCEKVPVVDYDSMKCNVPYLKFSSGEVELRRSSQHFTQCQVQMYISGMSECDFFIYSPVGSLCLPIQRDEDFLSDVISKAEEFYFQKYLPKLYEDRFTLLRKTFVHQAEGVKRSFMGKDIKNISKTRQK